MNKELIKTYKAEFDHWLNGGELLYAYIDDTFSWKNMNAIDKNIYPVYARNPFQISEYHIIIINDEYVEFRKALAEGKTIQMYCKYDDVPPFWDDMTEVIKSIGFVMTKDNYRIKPEEPKFKVGDFITVTGTSVSTEQVVKIDGDIIHVRNYGMCYARQATPWQPKKGDWCWFWNEGAIITVLELLEIVDDGNRKYFAAMPNIPHFLGGYYQYCEPFLGQLPTKLRN